MSTWLRLATVTLLTALIACSGGDSGEESWSVDPHDAGSRTDNENGGSDLAKGGSGGKKSEGMAGKDSAAMSGGSGGSSKGGSGGTGGKKSLGGTLGGGSSKNGSSKGGAGGKGGSGASNDMSSSPATSKACLECEKINPDGICKTRRAACPAFGQRTAMAGPSAGKLKTALCEELYECLSSTGCANAKMGLPASPTDVDLVPCLCGDTDFDSVCSLAAMPAGPCAAQIMAAGETMMAVDLAPRLIDPDYAVGAVFLTAQCDEVRCAKSCGYCKASDPFCVDTDMGSAGMNMSGEADGGV